MAVTHQEMCSFIFVYNCQMAVTMCGHLSSSFTVLSTVKKQLFFSTAKSQFPIDYRYCSQLGIEMEMGKL